MAVSSRWVEFLKIFHEFYSFLSQKKIKVKKKGCIKVETKISTKVDVKADIKVM